MEAVSGASRFIIAVQVVTIVRILSILKWVNWSKIARNFKGQIPSWFLKWWEMFGSTPQNLPEPLQDALRYFNSRFQTNKHSAQFPAILHMIIQYKIHWISMWNYAINRNLLDREFFTKWWDKFRPTDVISKLYKDFPLPVQKSIAHCTRSQSSLDSVQISGKSSKELKDLAQQLLIIVQGF